MNCTNYTEATALLTGRPSSDRPDPQHARRLSSRLAARVGLGIKRASQKEKMMLMILTGNELVLDIDLKAFALASMLASPYCGGARGELIAFISEFWNQGMREQYAKRFAELKPKDLES